MTHVYHDRYFQHHLTGSHPECPERVAAIAKYLNNSSLLADCFQPVWEVSTLEQMVRVHAKEYIERVRVFAEQGGGQIESDTILSAESYHVARHGAGAVCDAVKQVLTGTALNALCLVRPPGHHALSHAPMGFCLFNNAAIAARYAAVDFDLDRILIVDWDVHHGNGTQDIFWEDENVAFFSIHRWPFYPGTGDRHETGSGRGLGKTKNLPIEFGISRRDYRALFERELEKFANRIKPQMVIVSAGFDSHREDPIGSLGLETEDFSELTRIVMRIADTFAQGKIVSVLEGGYNVQVLPECVGAHLKELSTAE